MIILSKLRLDSLINPHILHLTFGLTNSRSLLVGPNYKSFARGAQYIYTPPESLPPRRFLGGKPQTLNPNPPAPPGRVGPPRPPRPAGLPLGTPASFGAHRVCSGLAEKKRRPWSRPEAPRVGQKKRRPRIALGLRRLPARSEFSPVGAGSSPFVGPWRQQSECAQKNEAATEAAG